MKVPVLSNYDPRLRLRPTTPGPSPASNLKTFIVVTGNEFSTLPLLFLHKYHAYAAWEPKTNCKSLFALVLAVLCVCLSNYEKRTRTEAKGRRNINYAFYLLKCRGHKKDAKGSNPQQPHAHLLNVLINLRNALLACPGNFKLPNPNNNITSKLCNCFRSVCVVFLTRCVGQADLQTTNK